MPKVKYYIFHCNKDKVVNIDAHSEKLVAEMKQRNYDLTYNIIEGRDHCDLILEIKRKFADYVIKAIDG